MGPQLGHNILCGDVRFAARDNQVMTMPPKSLPHILDNHGFCQMQAPFFPSLAHNTDALRLDALLKRVVSGDLTLPREAHGLSLPANVDFGAIDPDVLPSGPRQPPKLTVQLLNSSPQPITVTRIDLLPAAEVFAVYSDSSLLRPVALPAVIPAGSSLSFTVCLRATAYPGKLSCRLAVSALSQSQQESMELDQAWHSFMIGCMCSAIIRNPLVDSAADVEAKAFVPYAIRSIFDHAAPSYSSKPPARGSALASVCCFCHDETSQLFYRQRKSKTGKAAGIIQPSAASAEDNLIRLSDLMVGTPRHGEQPHVKTTCHCSFHISCMQRWAQVSSEELGLMLPCPACGLNMQQLPNVLATLQAQKKKPIGHPEFHESHFTSALTSMLKERIAHTSDVPTHSDIQTEIARREHFFRHIANLVEATKAEFFARSDENLGFTSFDVEFREIKAVREQTSLSRVS